MLSVFSLIVIAVILLLLIVILVVMCCSLLLLMLTFNLLQYFDVDLKSRVLFYLSHITKSSLH